MARPISAAKAVQVFPSQYRGRSVGGAVLPAVLTPGMAKNTYGSGCFLLMNTGSEAVQSRPGMLSTGTRGEVNYVLREAMFFAGAAM